MMSCVIFCGFRQREQGKDRMKKIREDNKKMRALPSGIFWQGSTPGKW